MKKIADFIINKRYPILAVMLVLTVVCGIASLQVGINTDMTKYLPDDSNMKQGLDLMETEFPDTAEDSAIRVMFDDLTGTQVSGIQTALTDIRYVDSVSYEADSTDYNKDNHTLFVVNTKYGYNSKEEASIEKAIEAQFDSYDMVFQNNDTQETTVPLPLLLAAIAILLFILLVMSKSWLEPVLFMAVIGIAVVINLGTNIFLGEISGMTMSIGPILQLVLSMDYSIILINRYRQEQKHSGDNTEAMKSALTKSFSSIASSSLTTVVGLLVLVFLSFKIGMEIGVVLAKGVFISMICVFTLLPTLILLCDKGIKRTAKKVPHIRTDGLAALSYKMRKVLPLVLAVLFAGAFILQSSTKITFTEGLEDPMADVFPKDNTTVLIYDNGDEGNIDALIASLEKDAHVKSVTGYTNTLGKAYTIEEMTSAVQEMGSDMPLDTSVIQMLYYNYYDGELPVMSAGEFLNFVAENVRTNDTFAAYLDSGITGSIDRLTSFADKELLAQEMSASELAELLGISESDAEQLYLYYYTQKGGIHTGTMTLPAFADFMINNVADNGMYASMLDKESFEQIKKMQTYTDTAKMTSVQDYKGIASMLGMDADTVKMLFVYYQAMNEGYTPDSMTFADFASFVTNEAVSNPAFSSYLSTDSLEQLNRLAAFTGKQTLQAQLSAAQLSGTLGMDENLIKQIFGMYYAVNVEDKTLTLPELTDYLVNTVLQDEAFTGYFDETAKGKLTALNTIAAAASAGQELQAEQLAQVSGMDAAMIRQLFAYRSAVTGDTVTSMTLTGFLDFVLNDAAQNPSFAPYFDPAVLAQLTAEKRIADAAASGQKLSYTQLAQILGMDGSLVKQIFAMYFAADVSDKTMSLEQMVNYLLSDETIKAALDNKTLNQLQTMQAVIDAVLNDTVLDAVQMAQLTGMEAGTARILYTCKAAEGTVTSWKLSMQTVVNFLVNNSGTFSDRIDADSLTALKTAQTVINSSAEGRAYSAPELAELLGMTAGQAEQLYTLYISETGDTSGWKLSPETFVDFVVKDVLADTAFAGQFDAEEEEQLKAAQTLMKAVRSEKKYSAQEMTDIMEGLTDSISRNEIELLYLYHAGWTSCEESWTLSIEQLFSYLTDDMMNEERFASVFDSETKDSLLELKNTLKDGILQMKGEQCSRLVITADYPEESDETSAFMDRLDSLRNRYLDGTSYVIGSSAMAHEMLNGFRAELIMITIITAAAIFLVVLLTFRSAVIPLLLVLLVQCAVYITIAVIGLQGGSSYYLALLIVQSILMGATIDYAIVFSTYYRDSRKTMEVKESLGAAYEGSIYTIMTSGLILIIITGLLGIFSTQTIAEVCATIAIGSLSAVLLILFILPGTLAFLDRVIVRKKKR